MTEEPSPFSVFPVYVQRFAHIHSLPDHTWMTVLMVRSKIRRASKNECVSAFMCVCRVCLKCVRDSEWACNKSQIAHLCPSIVWTVFKLLNAFFVLGVFVSVCQISISYRTSISFFSLLFSFNSELHMKLRSSVAYNVEFTSRKLCPLNTGSQQGARVAHKTPSVLYL